MKAHSAQSGFPKGRFNRLGWQVCGTRRGLCNRGGRRGGRDGCRGFVAPGGGFAARG